jgi:membrane protein
VKPYLNFFFKELLKRVGRHHLTAFSASMAYFFVLSIFPFLIFLFAILSKMEVAYSFLDSNALEFIPEAARSVLQDYVKNNLAAKSGSVLSVSILAALWSASRAVGSLQRSLNAAYEVRARKSPLKAIGISVFFTLGLSFSIVIMLLLPSLSSRFFEFIRVYIPISELFIVIFGYVRWILVIMVPIVILSQMYQHLPNLRLTLREVIPGTLFAYFGWIGISFLMSYFIQNFSSISLVYGSLAAVVVMMMWFYFSGMILMLGGEINSISKTYKSTIPDKTRNSV